MQNQSTEAFSKVRVYTLLGFGITAIVFSPILVKLATEESAFLVAAIRTVFAFLFLVPVYFSIRKN